MMNFGGRQTGIGFLGWMFLILLFGGALTIGLKLFPVYMDHQTMSGVLDGIADETGHAGKLKPQLVALIKQRFRLNNIREFDLENNVVIDKNDERTRITLQYEVRMPLAYNLDLVASFDKRVELRE